MNGTLKYLPRSEKTRELVTKWLNSFDNGHTYLSQEESDSSSFEGDNETNLRDCRLVSIHKKARQPPKVCSLITGKGRQPPMADAQQAGKGRQTPKADLLLSHRVARTL